MTANDGKPFLQRIAQAKSDLTTPIKNFQRKMLATNIPVLDLGRTLHSNDHKNKF